MKYIRSLYLIKEICVSMIPCKELETLKYQEKEILKEKRTGLG